MQTRSMENLVRHWLVLGLALLLPMIAAPADAPKPDPWQPVRFLLGQWEGTSGGQPGEGRVQRTYEFALANRYIHERNTSIYPPQEKNKKGETHEHWSMLSYDRARKLLVLRQFHSEGFVNQYVIRPEISTDKKVVFESERFENLSGEWRARESYETVGGDEFIETFEIAEPGKDFEIYSQAKLKRVR